MSIAARDDARHGSRHTAPHHSDSESLGPFYGTVSERVRYATLLAFLALCVLGGGASRADVLSLLYLRPAAIVCIAIFLLTPGRLRIRTFRWLFVMFGLLAATIAIQLIPLPPGIWLELPGNARLGEAAAAAGFALPWRPISLSPDLTLNSLMALLPPLAVLVGLAALRHDQRQALLPVLVAIMCADAFWSILQFATGAGSWAYLYAVTNEGTPVGFFSNRNHNAFLLALAFPVLAVWTRMPARSRERHRTRSWIAFALGLFFIPVILATGSRGGVLLGGAGIAVALFLLPREPGRGRGRVPLLRLAAALFIILGLVGLTIMADRAVSIERFLGSTQELRTEALPTLMQMVRDFAPQGTGFGAFDPAYRIYEPHWALGPTYFNHAHNDLVELVLTGGLAALAVLALFLLWWGRRSIAALTASAARSRTIAFARLGSVIILFLLAASLIDYPLRTPLLAVVFVIACGWLASGRAAGDSGEREEKRAASESRGRGARLAMIGATALVGIGLLWVTLGVTASRAVGRANPALVMNWWPFDADTRASAAIRALQRNPRRPDVAASLPLAEAALRREPVNVGAARTLAIAAAVRRNEPRAERLMRYAESLSRRDLPTQLWLIESAVQRNDIPGALMHYDRALRTSLVAGEVLFPVLVSASSSPDVRRHLVPLVASRPIWWGDFTRQLVAQGRSPAAIATIVASLRLDPADPIERDILLNAMNRLVDSGNFPQAFALYRRALGGRPVAAQLRNGDFEGENRLPPFDWQLTEHSGLSGIMEPVEAARGRALLVAARGGASGEVARQLILLPPGPHRLTASVGAIAGAATERPQITMTCARTGQPLLQILLPPTPASGARIGEDFTVPASGCPAQWVFVRVSSPLDGNSPNSWIDRVAIQRRN